MEEKIRTFIRSLTVRLWKNRLLGSVVPFFLDNRKVLCFEKNQADGILRKAFELRRAVFAGELGWVSPDGKDGEWDSYDAHAVHFLISEGKKILGYVRLIPPGNLLMLEKEFRGLLGKKDLLILYSRKTETAEVSRLVLPREARGGFTGFSLNMLLYRKMYQWSLSHGIRYWYMVITPKLLRFLRRFFPVEIIGVPKKYHQEHPESIVAAIDLREAEEKASRENPHLFKWFRKNQKKSG